MLKEKTERGEKASLLARILAESAFLSKGLFSGVYRSKMKGKGVEFDSLREYSFQDDKKEVDWRASAKFDKLFVKLFSEERELNVIFIVDISLSTEFGSSFESKRIFSTRIASLLALASLRNRDKVGFLLFSDRIEKYIAPRKGIAYFKKMIGEILDTKTEGKESNLEVPLDFLKKILNKKSICFLLSDFLFQEPSQKIIMGFLEKHDLAPVLIFDPIEKKLPMKAFFTLENLEGGEKIEFDAKSTKNLESYKKLSEEKKESTVKFWKKWGKEVLILENGKTFLKEIIIFLKKRKPFRGV